MLGNSAAVSWKAFFIPMENSVGIMSALNSVSYIGIVRSRSTWPAYSKLFYRTPI